MNMNNNGMWDSECSSGCESGWTVYLEQSLLFPSPSNISRRSKQQLVDCDEQDDDDMSMVSDASSGPPHFQQQHDIVNINNNEEPVIDCKSINNNGKRKKSKEKFRRPTTPAPLLHLEDDTASSPVFFDFSQNNSTMIHNNNHRLDDFSQGYSATHFQLQDTSSSYSSNPEQQLGYFHEYLPTNNQMQQNQWYGSGSMMGMRRY